MSQHLHTLYRAGVLDRRRDGVQIYYRIVNNRVVSLCRAVCTQIAIEGGAAAHKPGPSPAADPQATPGP